MCPLLYTNTTVVQESPKSEHSFRTIYFSNELKQVFIKLKEKNFNNINLLNDLKEKNLITTINEAHIIDLEKYNMPPYIIANKNKINKNLMYLSFIIQSKDKYNFLIL